MHYIFWFRKDLRTEDNKGLSEFIRKVSAGYKFSFIYIKNRNSYKYFGKKRISFLNNTLAELSEDIKSKKLHLQIFFGSSSEIFRSLSEKYGSISLYYNRQVEPYCIIRDSDVSEIIGKSGGNVNDFTDSTIFTPGEIKNISGDQYKVFTPFKNNILGRLEDRDFAKSKTDFSILDFSNEIILDQNPVKTDQSFEINKLHLGFLKGGRKEGLVLLKEFYENGIKSYRKNRDFPSYNGTSFLSAHLHFGTVGIREALRTARTGLKNAEEGSSSEAIQTWINELLWREFYYHMTFFNPDLTFRSFKKECDDLNWSYDESDFDRWCKGLTGYPIVDAGMRQLNDEGWMHNRLRMITAMFLTKDLFIDWRFGEKYFAENLIDMDFSSNNGGWQWCASTGADAQPYFRIFNPYLQSKKFDPCGDYIRRYVPELKNVSEKFIHEPHLMSNEDQKKCKTIIGKDYPLPIVEHSRVKERVLSEFKKLNKK